MRKFMFWTVCIAAMVLFDAVAQEEGAKRAGEATGFFHTQEIDGVWWLIDPEGKAFLSKGVNHVAYRGDHAPSLGYSPYNRAVEAKYGSASAWGEAAANNLRSWGFNTMGSWCDQAALAQGMPYTLILSIGERSGGDWQRGVFPDVFADGFREVAEGVAERDCAPRHDDPLLLGYFSDNELKWRADWRSSRGLFADFWNLASDAPGRQKAEAFIEGYYDGDIERLNAAWDTEFADWAALKAVTSLNDLGPHVEEAQEALRRNRLVGMITPEQALGYLKIRYGTIDEFNAVEIPEFGKKAGTSYASFEEVTRGLAVPPFGEVLREVEDAFSGVVAEQYFKVVAEVIRKHDPNHLLLGCRFAGYAPAAVLQGVKDNVDVVSYNHYGPLPPRTTLREIHEITGKPVLLTEFSFKAMDSGLPNSRGAGVPVATQQDRADGFDRYVTALMQLPFAVGFHWFEYADEPAEGRFDGENSNYGLVNIKDEPWETLTQRMTAVNARLESVHGADRR
jgi:agarase